MPLFEYKCRECDSSFEQLVSSSKRDEVSCKECGSENTKRQISVFSSSTGGSPAASIPSIPSSGFS